VTCWSAGLLPARGPGGAGVTPALQSPPVRPTSQSLTRHHGDAGLGHPLGRFHTGDLQLHRWMPVARNAALTRPAHTRATHGPEQA
jgi:hypothetical protein